MTSIHTRSSGYFRDSSRVSLPSGHRPSGSVARNSFTASMWALISRSISNMWAIGSSSRLFGTTPHTYRCATRRNLSQSGGHLAVHDQQSSRTDQARRTGRAAGRRTSCPCGAARRSAPRSTSAGGRPCGPARPGRTARRLPDVAELAVQQRRPARRDRQRVTVGDEQRVPAVAGRVSGQEHLVDRHVQAGRDRALGLDGVVERLAVRQVDRRPVSRCRDASRDMVDPKVICWSGLSGWPSPAA